MKKFTLISTDEFCHLILAVLGVEGEYDGFINDGKLKQLCYIINNVVASKMLRIKLTF